MVDGIAGVGLLTALLDLAPDTPVGAPEPWEPHAEPPGALKVLDAWGGLAGDLAGMARSVPSSAVHPVRTLRSAASTVTRKKLGQKSA